MGFGQELLHHFLQALGSYHFIFNDKDFHTEH
jgi:hypothetical protein